MELDGIVLSFDDGPHPEHTPIILAELATRNIKAVFFVSGLELTKYPDLGRKIVEDGHLLGNHAFDHLNVKERLFSDYRESIEKADDIICRIAGDDYPKLFRPPFSAFSFKLIWYILFSKYLLVNWTIDSRDSYISEPDELFKYVSGLKIKNGDILLFHEDYCQTVAALPKILDYLQKRNFQFRLPQII